MTVKAGGTMLTENRTRPTQAAGAPSPAPPRHPGRLLAALPLAGLSLVATLVLTASGLLTLEASAVLIALVVVVASMLHLGFTPRRLPASLLGLLLVAAPALVSATAILAIAAQVGVPITVLSTRLAAVSGWWLALVVMRPLVDRLGTTRMPTWRAGLIFAPSLVVLGMVGYAWRATDTAQRFAFLFRAEDNATWVSHAYALLRHGHPPGTLLESEYYAYSSISSFPGVLTDVALRGRPRTHASTAYTAIDVALANQLLAIAAAGAILGAALLAALVLFDRGKQRPPALGIVLLSTAVTGVGASVVAGTPTLVAGHLSLAWADVAIVLMALFVVTCLRAATWPRFLPTFTAACLASYVAASSWVYIVITPIVFAILLVVVRRSGLREKGDGAPIGHGGRILCLAAGLIVACLLAAVPQFVYALQQVGLAGLSGAPGGVAAVEPLTLAGAVLVGIGVAFVAYRWADGLSLVVTLLMAAAAAAALLVFLTGVLPGNNPTYALTKSLYVLLAISALGVVALVAQASRTRHHRLFVIGSLVLATLVTTSPTFGSVIKWPNAVTEPDAGPASRILKLAAKARPGRTVACRPSPYLEQINNYLCNRWAEALAPRQGNADFRLAVLYEYGAAPNAWEKYRANGFLKGATVGDAAQLMTGKCVPDDGPAGTSPARHPHLAVHVRSFEPKHPLVLQGHVDAVRRCTRNITVVGWAPFTKNKESLDVWAAGPVTVVRAQRRERPDVMSRYGSSAWQSPGYVLVLRMRPDQVRKLCVSVNGDTGSILGGGSTAAGCSQS